MTENTPDGDLRRRSSDPLPLDEEHVEGLTERNPTVLAGAISVIITLVLCLIAIAIMSSEQADTIDDSADVAAERVQREQQQSQVNACNGTGNLTRALANALSQGDPLAREYLPILDCNKTYKVQGGIPAPLSPDLQRCYITLIKRNLGQRPVVPPPSNPVALRQLCVETGDGR